MRHLRNFNESIEIPQGTDPRANEIMEIFQDVIDEFHLPKEKIHTRFNGTNPGHSWMKIEVPLDSKKDTKPIASFLINNASHRIEHLIDAHMFIFSTHGGYVIGFRDDRGNEILTISIYSH